MKLELSTKDANVLSTHLSRRLTDLQRELVHTTDRALHRALANDVRELESLTGRVRRLLDEARTYA